MELIKVVDHLNQSTSRLSKATKEVFKLAKDRAETEREYRLALSQEMFWLRDEGLPATMIPDLARGNISKLKYDRDLDRKSTRLNSSHVAISYAVFCLKQ